MTRLELVSFKRRVSWAAWSAFGLAWQSAPSSFRAVSTSSSRWPSTFSLPCRNRGPGQPHRDRRSGARRQPGDTFIFLSQRDVITAETAAAMQQGTKLRNLIAHAYGDVDPKKLFVAASAGIGQIERFLAETGAWVTARSGGG